MKLFIIDALAMAYRAHFAFISRPRVTSRGENTSAAYGFTTALLKLINEYGIDHVVTVFDVMGEEAGTFRDELFDAYKAHRQPPPEALIENMPHIKAILDAMGVPILEIQGVEADDVIATLATRLRRQGDETVIVSADKDFQQLLGPTIRMLKPARKGDAFEWITEDTFRESFDLEPRQFIDVLALMGDSVDNVPGVPGIGEKTALKLIQHFGNVESLLERAHEVDNKRAREGLQNEADKARLSKRLVTLLDDLEFPFEWKDAVRSEPDWPALESLFEQLEFRTLLDRLRPNRDKTVTVVAGEELEQRDDAAVEYIHLTSLDAVRKWLEETEFGDRLAIETVAIRPTPLSASLVGLGLSTRAGAACYIPVPLPDGTTTREVLSLLAPAIQNGLLVGRRLKEDLILLEREGLRIRPKRFDTSVAHYLLAPEQRHDVDLLARNHLSYAIAPPPDEAKTDMRSLDFEDAGKDVTERVDVIGRLYKPLRKELDDHDLARVADQIEMPLIGVLADMERTGISVDRKMLRAIGTELETEIDDLELQIYASAGERFTIGSPQQLGEILYTKLGLAVKAKTAKGQASTREQVLQELSTEHPLPGLILDWRRASKLKSTYVDALGELIDPRTGRVHTQFNQTITATGRLSSSNPNLQNIPVRSEKGRQLRRAFIPKAGWLLMSADYVQIELRILASMSGDAALMQAFSERRDIHSDTAARLFGVDPESVTRAQRSKAKEVNYGIPYGISSFGLAQRLRVPRAEAQALIDAHRDLYPGVWKFLAVQVERAREKGFSETLLGRRRYLPALHSRNRPERAAAERMAVNMPIQGTQADMIKLAMIRIHRALADEGLQACLLLQVHDELVLEIPPSEEDSVRSLVKAGMTEAFSLHVPVEVELETGPNWLEVH